MKAKEKSLYIILIITILLYIGFILLPRIKVDMIINNIYEDFIPYKVEANVRYNFALNKDFKIEDSVAVEELCKYIFSIEVRKKPIKNIIHNHDSAIDRFIIRIIAEDKKEIFMYISSDRCIQINSQVYKVRKNIDYKKIYSILLSTGDVEKIAPYYIDILEQL